MRHPLSILLATLALLFGGLLSHAALASPPSTENGVTRIHLEQHNGYFTARETLAGLKPGSYEFVISNKAGKLVGFQIQDASGKELDKFPIEPGQTRTSRVEISAGGFRYRCPINPTPWYEVGVDA
jgi:hypothetical protein